MIKYCIPVTILKNRFKTDNHQKIKMRALILVAMLVLQSQAVFESGIKQGSLFTPEKLSRLERSSLGRAIIHLAELASTTKGEFDFSQLWEAIDELGADLDASKNDENESFETDRQQYVADAQFYSTQVTQFENEVAQLQVDVQDLVTARTSFEHALNQKNGELEETKSLVDALERTIAQNERVFVTQSQDYDAVISIIDQAIDLLSQVRESPSFLQHDSNKEKMSAMGATLEQGFKNLDKSRRVFFQPLVKHFVQLAQQGFADQNLLNKALSSLNGLRGSLVDNKQALTNAYETEKSNNEQIHEEYQQKLHDLSDVVIPQLLEDIAQKNGEINTKKGILNDATNNLNDAQDGLDATEERWLQRQKTHTELIAEYDNDLAVVNDAINALQRGGITRS